MADFNELITCMISLVSINFIISSNYSEKELIKVQVYYLCIIIFVFIKSEI